MDTETKIRIRELAESLDCLVEDDLELLAGVKASTSEAWRKRGTGPAFVRLGNTFLYPRSALRAFLADQVRAPRNGSAKDTL